MHPMQILMERLPNSSTERSRQQKASRKGSAMERHHAEALAWYIKDIFLNGELLGEGVKPSWTLNGRRSQSISYDKWLIFQTLFIERWDEFVRQHGHDEFWTENQPAFHTYDHGANIEIEVKEPLHQLSRETRVRADDNSDGEDSDSNSGNDSDIDSDNDNDRGNAIDNGNANDNDNGNANDNANDSGNANDSANDNANANDNAEDNGGGGGEEHDRSVLGHPAGDDEDGDDNQRALYSDGLEQLRKELKKKYNLDHIE